MRELSKIRVEMFPGKLYPIINLFYRDGSQEEKIVELNVLIDILNSVRKSEDFKELGRIPKGYYNGRMRVGDTTTFDVVILLPKAVRLLTYSEEEFLVPFPELVFLFQVEKGILIGSQCFAVYEKNNQKYVARYPFGNVYRDGRICWGANNMEYLYSDNIQQVEKLVELFLGSETNNDLYQPGQKEFIDQKNLILALVKKVEFPETWLIKSEASLDSVVEKFMNGVKINGNYI